MTPKTDLTKRRFFAATITAVILATAVLAAATPAHAFPNFTLWVAVRPAGAGDILVDGVYTPSYPYTYVMSANVIHNFRAVPMPRNPALVLPGELDSHFYFNTWRGPLGGENPMNWPINSHTIMIAEFKSRLGIARGRVWDDTNRNGVLDEGEPGLSNWLVQLHDAATGAVVSQDYTYTEANDYHAGDYMLASQEPGNFYLTFELKPGYVAVDRHVGGNKSFWSEAYPNPYPLAPAPGQAPHSSAAFSLLFGGNDEVMNAGYFKYAKNLTPDAAKTLSEENRDTIFLDVREAAEANTRRIPCFTNYPLNSGVLAAQVEALKAEVGGFGATIVTVSDEGFRSTTAANFLSDYGFTNVSNMVPGMDDWRWYTLGPGQAYPVSNAGFNTAVPEGTTYTLNGSQSSDYNIYSYTWTQVSGPTVVLSEYNTLMPTFFAPAIAADANAVFRLRVEAVCSQAPVVTSDVTINLTDNGIADYPADVTPFLSYNGRPLGVKVTGGTIVRLSPANPAIYTQTVNRPDGMPYGIFDWAVRTNELGGEAKVTFYFPDLQSWYYTWVKYNKKTGQWSNYGDHALWYTNLKQLTITVVDGGIGDDDGKANWIVEDPGGLGFYNADEPDDPTPVDEDLGTSRGDDSGTARGCFISSLGL